MPTLTTSDVGTFCVTTASLAASKVEAGICGNICASEGNMVNAVFKRSISINFFIR